MLATAMSAAVIRTTRRELLTNAVARGLLFHSTTELDTKFEPPTNTSKSAPPATAFDGESEEAVGLGLSGPVIGNATEGEAITSPGVLTATLPEPTFAMSSAGTVAVA